MQTDSPTQTNAVSGLIKLATPYARREGVSPTNADYLSVISRSKPSMPVSSVLSPALCLILQGKKVFSTAMGDLVCGPGDFIVSLLEIPVVVHVEEASAGRPYIGLKMEFGIEEIAELVRDSQLKVQNSFNMAEPRSFVGSSSTETLSILERILTLDNLPGDAYRARLLRKDLLFSLLSGPSGHLFMPWILSDESGTMRRVVMWLREHFDRPFHIEDLARRFNISASGLQHKFKDFTSMSILQYQKMLRLQRARLLLFSGRHDVSQAAFAVGYQSLPQFSREYKRLFGQPPRADIDHMRREIGTRLPSEIREINQGAFA